MSDCNCPACTALAARYADDPKLLAFYQTKLLQRYWAGKLDDIEKAYVLAHAGWMKVAVEAGARNIQTLTAHAKARLQRAQKPEAVLPDAEHTPTPVQGVLEGI